MPERLHETDPLFNLEEEENVERLDDQVQKAQEQLIQLKRQQDQIEKQKRELDTDSRTRIANAGDADANANAEPKTGNGNEERPGGWPLINSGARFVPSWDHEMVLKGAIQTI